MRIFITCTLSVDVVSESTDSRLTGEGYVKFF